jgi:glycosyltransferase involved in cell wall biosynthesis
VGGAALAISYLRRIPLIFEVRDLWPESAVALGELSHPRAISLATRLELACYSRARKIVVVTQGIRNRLLERGIPAQKLALIPNGANTELFRFDEGLRQATRQALGLEDKFIALYAGIHGVAQGLETLAYTAHLLADQADIHFLLIGEGPKKAEIAALVSGLGLTNFTMLPEQPRDAMPAYLSAADAALIPLRALELFKGALPSKMFDAWACQRPVLLSVDGEARQVMEAAGGGVFIPPEDPAALAQAILALKSDAQRGAQMGAAGRIYTQARYSRRALADQLARLLELTPRA